MTMNQAGQPPAVPPRTFWANFDWANQHYGELLKLYDNQWVGVYQQKVVGADPNLGRLESELEKKYPRAETPLIFVAGASHIY